MTFKELREKEKLSQAKFAKALGISASLVSAIETGAKPLSDAVISKAKEIYGVAIEKAAVAEAAAKVEAEKAVEKAEEVVKTEAAKVEAKAEKQIKETKSKAKAKAKKVAEQAEAVIKDEAAKVEQTVEAKAEKQVKAAKTKAKTAGTKAKAAAKQAKATVKAQASKVVKNALASVMIQSPLGGEITPAEILAKLPADVDKVYVRVDQNKAYWVKGEESGSVDLW